MENHTNSPQSIVTLDVRPILETGRDPFLDIMGVVKNLKSDETMCIIVGFEPHPLYKVLGDKGFIHYAEFKDSAYHVYFTRSNQESDANELDLTGIPDSVVEIDVRELAPPEPMEKILETLTTLTDSTVLVVHHHREPFMLYDALDKRGYKAITNKIDENYYKVIITKNS